MNCHRNNIIKTSVTILAIICIFTFFSENPLIAAKKKTAITFTHSNIEIAYHQPFKNGYKSNHPSYIEVPRINHIINLFQNYINYLKKLNRITGNPMIRINYTPDVIEEEDGQRNRIIKTYDLGINNLLTQINNYLVEYDYAKASDLIDDLEGLKSIPDGDITRSSNFSSSSYFTNLSLAIPSNEPDTSYVIVDKDTVLSTRTGKKTNLIYRLSLNHPEDSGVFSEEAQIWYQNMKPTYDGKYLAYTDGLYPYVINLQTKEAKPLISNENKKITLLNYEWSPTSYLLAGIILDETTEERYVFIYDAEKNQHIDVGHFSKNLTSNYLNATPIWSPQGNKIIFTSSRSLHLIDLKANKSRAKIVTVDGQIGEFIWSKDENSFAFTEIKGQNRSPNHFDDFDYRGSTLHRYRFNDTMMEVAEDYAQCIQSRNTIKLISFIDNDQVLYLEGRLVAPNVPGAFWDLSKTFNAYLTPASQDSSTPNHDSKSKITPQQLPLQYLFVYRSLDNKNTNIYDSGNGHSNLSFISEFYSCWFIGLYRPNGIEGRDCVYNFRPSPYPFGEYNYSYFLTESAGHVKLLLKFFQDYNIRTTDTSDTVNLSNSIFMQANFSGILNIWTINYKDLVSFLVYGDKPKKANKEDITPITEENTTFSDDIPELAE